MKLVHRIIGAVIALAVLTVLGFVGWSAMHAGKTIHELLGENRELKKNITNLTREETTGYAKVIEQKTRDGELYTRILFVVTDQRDKTKRIIEKEYELKGDIIHFDALIVKFEPELVKDGKEKALFLWRRIYSSSMSPEQGYPIDIRGEAPERYSAITSRLSLNQSEMFWSEIWKLASDPERLRDAGVIALYGNAVYTKMRPGLIYRFTIDASGTFYPETIPDL